MEKDAKKGNGFLEWIEFHMTCAAVRPTWRLLDTPHILYNITVLVVCGVSGWIMFYLKYDDLSLNTDILIHAVCTVHTLYIYLMQLTHRDKLYRISSVMHSRFRETFQKLQVGDYQVYWDKADRLTHNLLRFGTYLAVSVFSLYVYNSDLFSSKRNLVYPLWVPYSLQSNVNYFLTVTVQITIFALYIFINVSCHGFGIGGAHFIGASYDVLGNVFRDICKPKSGYKEKNWEIVQRQDADLLENLKNFVETHESILKLIRDYKSVYEVIYIEVLVSCEIDICFSGFQLVMAFEMQDVRRIVMLFCMIILISFHLFLYCYQGQHISNKSEQFRDSLYLSHWEEHSLGFQRSLAIMLLTTSKPVTVSYKGVFHSSMHSFLNAMKTAFSYINILLVLRELH